MKETKIPKLTAKEVRFNEYMKNRTSPEVTNRHIENLQKKADEDNKKRKLNTIGNTILMIVLFIPMLLFGSFFYLAFKAVGDSRRADY